MIIQKIIISVSLFVIYYLIFGLTAMIAFLFNRKILNGGNTLQDTSWLEATGYEPDMTNSKAQS